MIMCSLTMLCGICGHIATDTHSTSCAIYWVRRHPYAGRLEAPLIAILLFLPSLLGNLINKMQSINRKILIHFTLCIGIVLYQGQLVVVHLTTVELKLICPLNTAVPNNCHHCDFFHDT